MWLGVITCLSQVGSTGRATGKRYYPEYTRYPSSYTQARPCIYLAKISKGWKISKGRLSWSETACHSLWAIPQTLSAPCPLSLGRRRAWARGRGLTVIYSALTSCQDHIFPIMIMIIWHDVGMCAIPRYGAHSSGEWWVLIIFFVELGPPGLHWELEAEYQVWSVQVRLVDDPIGCFERASWLHPSESESSGVSFRGHWPYQ